MSRLRRRLRIGRLFARYEEGELRASRTLSIPAVYRVTVDGSGGFGNVRSMKAEGCGVRVYRLGEDGGNERDGKPWCDVCRATLSSSPASLPGGLARGCNKVCSFPGR
jgi:hypothetical protein